ncbi:PD-(D/E)XK nuclease family protein [Arthrobacter sp. FW305-BF8]|uniref:PD-(D/E)XK nuclease family protein n=1 Tax=Arthrobacter sp. FW305-BF8 TaxID=2879617 RepID=UPI001F1AA09C|nr:PD-(D/E)XK nuclease family protein [Arthrobacter sp. FW305-BF8]UKA55482.1 PD-(D/E)XK nuclease family protein [Arthrobacter sp. FW305-BF8]
MNVLFGLYLDRAPWTYRDSALGTVRLGPLGLVQLLQTRLGLTGPDARHSTRIRQYMARLAEQDTPQAWFHGSFSVDPWSTAIDLLDIRDELVVNGWTGLAPDGSTAKLQALAALEQSLLPLDLAFADYPLELIRELEGEPTSHWPLGIVQLELQHPRSSFPAIWSRLIDALERRGVRIAEPSLPTEPVGEVTVLVAKTEWEAAEHTARWLASAANPDADLSAVVASTSTALLDQELQRRGLPRIGVSNRSRWRAIDQIIPLFFNVIWGPVDVQLLGEFLNLPVSPVRRAAARHLLHALAAQPGTGGDEWLGALQKISAEETLGPDVAAELDQLLSTELLIDDGTVSGTTVVERAQWLRTQLSRRVQLHPRLEGVLSQLNEFTALIDGPEPVTRKTLVRILESVIPASASPLAGGEAAPWVTLHSLSELCDDVDGLVWWGCQDDGRPRSRHWDDAERQSLLGVGVQLPDPAVLAELELSVAVNAARRCRRVLLVRAAEISGEPTKAHPVLSSLAFTTLPTPLPGTPEENKKAVEHAISASTTTPAELVHDGVWRIAGRTAALAPVQRSQPEPVPAAHELGPRPAFLPDKLSFTQLSTLIGCSMKWVLEKKGRLKMGDGQSVPTGNTMIGTLVHKLVEELFAELRAANRAVPEPAEVQVKLDQLVPHYASELLLPGRGGRLAGLRPVIQNSVITFFQTLQSQGVYIRATEHEFSKPAMFNVNGAQIEVRVSGYIDVLAADQEAEPVVIDLKWTNRPKYRREEITKGDAMQLALYHWALDEGPDPMSTVAEDAAMSYYMLKQGEFASTSKLFGQALSSPASSRSTWQRSVRAAEFSISEVVGGRVMAAGRQELGSSDEQRKTATAADRLYQKPSCNFCDFSVLCGLKGDLS